MSSEICSLGGPARRRIRSACSRACCAILEKAAEMAARARQEVVAKRDIRGMTERLVESYRAEIVRKRATYP